MLLLKQLIGANTAVIVTGRRTGKTDSIAAQFVLRNMQRMPGSTGGIVVPTFKHGLTNAIPGNPRSQKVECIQKAGCVDSTSKCKINESV